MIDMLMQIIAAVSSLLVLGFVLNWLDYTFMKNRYLKKGKFDLNVCCGDTACGGVNADIVKRNVPRFVLVKDIYSLPFRNKQFKNAICSHTMEHVEDPVKFFKELKRVSNSVTILVPPIWDYGCMLNIFEHKRQFVTLWTKHVNKLPKSFPLPLAGVVQSKYGQKI